MGSLGRVCSLAFQICSDLELWLVLPVGHLPTCMMNALCSAQHAVSMHDVGVVGNWPQNAMHAMMLVQCLTSINMHEIVGAPSWH